MNIGIIGGADGPTAIYVASSFCWPYIIGAAAVIFGGIIAYLVIKNRQKKDC